MSKKIFIFLIIFLIVLGFLIFNFWKTEKIEASPGLENVYGWAWAENIGWISVNSKNCDTDGDGTMEVGEGTVGCPPVGTIIPAYGVYLPKGGTEQRFENEILQICM